MDIKPYGVGFFSKGVGNYAPQTVLILAKAIMERNSEAKGWVHRIKDALSFSAAHHLNNQLSLANHGTVGLVILQTSLVSIAKEPR